MHLHLRMLAFPQFCKKQTSHLNQSGGCVLIHNHPSRQLEVPLLHLHKHNVSVQGTPYRSQHSSPGVHMPRSQRGWLPPLSGHIGPSRARQLASPSTRPDFTHLPPLLSAVKAGTSGLQAKCGLVGTRTSPKKLILKHSFCVRNIYYTRFLFQLKILLKRFLVNMCIYILHIK